MNWDCNKCNKIVVGSRSEHCPGCHETFASTAAGDAHRIEFRCHEPAGLRRKDGNPKLERDQHGRWRLWLTPEQRAAHEAFLKSKRVDA